MEAVMTKIVERVERAIDMFYIENAGYPKFLILSPAAWADMTYEVNRANGLSDDDALLTDLNEYKGILVAVSHKPGIEDVYVV